MVAVTAAVEPTFEITRSTIDGGGTMRSQGGNFELSGTIGQPDAGQMSSNNFTLTGGFWIEIPPGDCEDDGDVDLFDYDQFRKCMTGPDRELPSESCLCFDVNGSRTIDLRDFFIIQSNYTGP